MVYGGKLKLKMGTVEKNELDLKVSGCAMYHVSNNSILIVLLSTCTCTHKHIKIVILKYNYY